MKRFHAGNVATIMLVVTASLAASAQDTRPSEPHWVATWATPLHFDQNTPWGFEKFEAQLHPGGTPSSPANKSGGKAAATTQGAAEQIEGHTVRMIVRLSLGGSTLRLRLMNAFGSAPVRFDDVHIALQTAETHILKSSDRHVTFSGKTSVTMDPGVAMLSDPLELTAPTLAHLCVSLYLNKLDTPPTIHPNSLFPVSFISSGQGDFTASDRLTGSRAENAYYWLSGIDVTGARDGRAIVAMGDSITDAVGAQQPDEDWPSKLAECLAGGRETKDLGVVNVGISGNRFLSDGAGIAGLARLEHDALLQPSAKWLILLEGVNDLGFASMLNSDLSAQHLIDGYRQVIWKAHAVGVKVVGCTLLPYKGAGYYRPEWAAVRREVNEAIRHQHIFDAVVDFDAIMRDPQDPESMRADLQRGDHLHPNAAGYNVMAQSINISMFQ